MTVLCVGDVVDDIGVRPLGRINPASDTEAEIRMTAGGSAANVATWLADLGASVRFVGRAGHDGVARHLAAMPGVDARIGGADLTTATIVLTLDDAAERTMFVDRGANATLTRADFPEEVWDGVTWLHLTGYTFFDPETRPVARWLQHEAGERGIPLSIDPSSLGFLESVGADIVRSWFADADLLFPNEDEQDFLGLEAGRSVLTLGPAGARFGDLKVDADEADVIDTTGAGDAFCAGFLSVWVEGRDAQQALAAGAAAAARCVALRGARP